MTWCAQRDLSLSFYFSLFITETNIVTYNAGHTSRFPLTSASCNSFPFRAVWKNPPGRGAAAYYRPLSVKHMRIVHVQVFVHITTVLRKGERNIPKGEYNSNHNQGFCQSTGEYSLRGKKGCHLESKSVLQLSP